MTEEIILHDNNSLQKITKTILEKISLCNNSAQILVIINDEARCSLDADKRWRVNISDEFGCNLLHFASGHLNFSFMNLIERMAKMDFDGNYKKILKSMTMAKGSNTISCLMAATLNIIYTFGIKKTKENTPHGNIVSVNQQPAVPVLSKRVFSDLINSDMDSVDIADTELFLNSINTEIDNSKKINIYPLTVEKQNIEYESYSMFGNNTRTDVIKRYLLTISFLIKCGANVNEKMMQNYSYKSRDSGFGVFLMQGDNILDVLKRNKQNFRQNEYFELETFLNCFIS